MLDSAPSSMPPHVALSALPTVMPLAKGVVWITVDGKIETINRDDAVTRLNRCHALFCHKKWTAAHLGIEASGLGALEGLDALELFAFVRPSQFCLPTAQGLGQSLGFDTRGSDGDQALLIPKACQRLLAELSNLKRARKAEAASIASMMTQGGWGWGPLVLAALGRPMPQEGEYDKSGASIWTRLEKIPEYTAPQKSRALPVNPDATKARLKSMLGKGAEIRSGQTDFSTRLLPAFDKPRDPEVPVLVMAEAGTGTGKTLGYLAPAMVWAEVNKAPVWVSTYTKYLQHQVVEETARHYPSREKRDAKVVILKGRENYLCLLNLEEALSSVETQPGNAIALGLMARWAEANQDGDLTGPYFPAWLTDLLEQKLTTGLSDHRGECIHSACPHYNKCFIEKSRQKSHNADIVVTNHAYAMITASMSAPTSSDENTNTGQPTRYVFDEGHHVFDAADSAFAVFFCMTEAISLRTWIRGHGRGGINRAGGIKKRLENLLAGNESAMADVDAALEAALILPTSGWKKRFSNAVPSGPVEEFLYHIRQKIYARSSSPDQPYDLEEKLYPIDDELGSKARELAAEMEYLISPLKRLISTLEKMLVDQADQLDSTTRTLLRSTTRGLMQRAYTPLDKWCQMVLDIATPLTPEGRPRVFDWMEITRKNGKDTDVGLRRHHLDPTLPFSKYVLKRAHGTVITSATLTGHANVDTESPSTSDWNFAKKLTGAAYLQSPAITFSVPSPFDYEAQTKVLLVNDVEHDDPKQIAGAMAGLMKASGGGALGLFTSVNRLKAAYPLLVEALAQHDLPLFAQHTQGMGVQTLLRIFREITHSCLLGTDGVRDGVDVPGRALHLIVCDRVPWARQNLLFKARDKHFGTGQLSDHVTRMKLQQAFGRLIRRSSDRGVFVMLDNRLSSRMFSAFPNKVSVQKVGIAEAAAVTRDFLKDACRNEA